MKKFLTLALVAGLAIGATSAVYANVCAFDTVPAATLLFPFVAFDYNNPIDGNNTLFAITNVSSEAQIVHITVWSDLSIAVLDFNVVLSGYDVQTMSIRDIMFYGDLPNTGTATPLVVSGGVRADGPYLPATGLPDPGGTDDLYYRCAPSFTSYPDYPTIPQATLDLFKTKLQYSQTFLRYHVACDTLTGYQIGDWFESRTTADTTWMYITADVVWTCNKMFPDGTLAYWQDYTGNVPDASGFYDENGPQRMTDNVIIGDVFWVNDAARFSEMDNAVHIEADVDLLEVATPYPFDAAHPISFYTRYAYQIFSTEDYREPLPTAWAFRYLGNGIADIDTYIRAWKGSDYPTIFDLGYDTDAGEIWAWDCMAYTYYAWDEDENVIQGPGEDPWSGSEVPPGLRPNLLPLETQEVLVDQFNLPDVDGWMLFVWPWSNGMTSVTVGSYTYDQDLYQTWMGVKYAAYGTYSAFAEGAVMANFNCFSNQVLPNLGINYDYVVPFD